MTTERVTPVATEIVIRRKLPVGEMESLRYYWGVPAARGGRIAYTYEGRREGTITSARDHTLWVRFDDGKIEGIHPAWEVEYLDATKQRRCHACGRTATAAYWRARRWGKVCGACRARSSKEQS